MKRSTHSLRGLARDIWEGATPIVALGGGLVLFALRAQSQVVLDDYSVSDEANYNYLGVLNDPADGWNVSSGELRPTIAGNAAGAWLWRQGERLSAVGDSVSISLSLPADAINGFGTGVGLFFAPNKDSAADGHQVLLVKFGNTYLFNISGLTTSGSFASSGSLTVKMTAQTPTNSAYSVSYSGNGSGNPFAVFTADRDSLFFGPEAFNTDTTAAAMDNLTFTAVPEPSAYGTVLGVLALAISLTGPGLRRSRTALRRQT